jgi:hypothetical protein
VACPYTYGEAGENGFKEDAMKKLFVLVGLAAAAYGAMKLMRGNEEDEFNIDQYAAPQPQA